MASRMRANGAEPKTRTPGDFLRRCLREISRHEKAVLSGNDPDAVHDMRVASRRLRAALAFLKSALPERTWRRALRRARRVTRAAGDLRQFDVNAQLLDRLIAEAAEVRPAAEFARPFLAADRVLALTTSRKALRRADPGKLRKEVQHLARLLDDRDLQALSRPAAKKAARRARRLSRLWGSNGAGPGLGASTVDKARLHAIRIATKKLRYHLETGKRICGWQVEAAIETAREIQDAFGELHDDESLRHWCESHRDEAAGYMGELIRFLGRREAAAIARIASKHGKSHETLIARLADT